MEKSTLNEDDEKTTVLIEINPSMYRNTGIEPLFIIQYTNVEEKLMEKHESDKSTVNISFVLFELFIVICRVSVYVNVYVVYKFVCFNR